MGVKTKDFGPVAWIFMESMGRYYDDFIGTDITNKQIRDLMRQLMFLIGFVLPCVYCRISYRQFTNPKNPEIDIEKLLILQDGGKKFVYQIHQRVSKKLEEQELAKNPENLEEIKMKWKKHTPSWSEAIQNRFVSINTKKFWKAYVMFLAYIMCDYRPQDHVQIFQFIKVVGQLLALSKDPEVIILSKAYQRAWTYVQFMSVKTDTLAQRIDIVWNILKYIFTVKSWKIKSTPLSFQKMCSSSIVTGCDKPLILT